MIQISVLIEILISCFLGLEMLKFKQWATQPHRTLKNRHPSGCSTEGQSAWLVQGMPQDSSTWSEGSGQPSRA